MEITTRPPTGTLIDTHLLDNYFALLYIYIDTGYSHGDDVPLLVADAVLRVGVLADHAVQAAVGHLGVARAGQVHRQHLASQQVTATAVPQFGH